MAKTKDVIQISTDNMPEIWEKYKRLAFRAASLFMKLYPTQIEDIKQECYLAMAEAVEHYNPERGAFSTCLPLYVRAYVGPYCRRNSCIFHISEYQLARLRGTKETDKQKQDAYAAVCAMNASSMSDFIKDADGITVADAIADEKNGIDEALDRIAARELHSNLSKLLLCVSETDRDYIQRHYCYGQTYADIGKKTGNTAVNISLRTHAALRKMRKKARRMRIFDEYLDGRTRSKALRGGAASFNTSWTSSTERAAIDRIEQEMRVNWYD